MRCTQYLIGIWTTLGDPLIDFGTLPTIGLTQTMTLMLSEAAMQGLIKWDFQAGRLTEYYAEKSLRI